MNTALIIVDMQRDFLPGGALAVTDGDQVIDPIRALAEQADLTVATRDWHPLDHSSFAENGGKWPEHCVAGSKGAEIIPEIDALADVIVSKGQTRDGDGYSAFEGGIMAALLREVALAGWGKIGRVVVCGLALDYCVRATALDAASVLPTVVPLDATRPVAAETGDRAIRGLAAAGVEVEIPRIQNFPV